MNKYYFYDTGIRNYLINNFNAISQRNDIGQLWETFLFAERTKYFSASGINSGRWFWRAYTGAVHLITPENFLAFVTSGNLIK